jgi:hypothetical protein
MFNYEKVIGIVMIYFGNASFTVIPNNLALPSLGLSTHFVRRHPRWLFYPKPLKQQTSGLPMLRIVIPTSSPYPKPCKHQTSFAVWLFCFSSVYESKLSTQPQNKKASQLC